MRSALIHILLYSINVGIISLILMSFPHYLTTHVFDLIARTILTCVIGYHALPLVRRLFLNQKISPQNKAVLITGCDSGFGHNFAKRLDLKGFQVFAGCLFPDGDGSKALKESCSSSLHVVALDVTKIESVTAALDYVKKNVTKSELWAIVNNAGITKGFEIEWTRTEDFQEVMDVNAMGVVRVTKAFLPLLRRSKGRVIIVTSVAAKISTRNIAAYSMSKFAASCFGECLRQEMRPWGVKVVTIEPYFFRTPITNWKVLGQKVDALVQNLDEETKAEYGEHYFEAYKKAIKRVLQFSCSRRLYEVIDFFEDAIMLREPCDVYRLCGNPINRLTCTVIELLPKPLADSLLRAAMYLTGYPRPKGAE